MRFSQAISRARTGCAKGGGSEVSELAGDIGARKTKVVMSHERREQRFRKCAAQNSLTFFQTFGTFAFYSSRNTRSTWVRGKHTEHIGFCLRVRSWGAGIGNFTSLAKFLDS